jgi:hypothetical protein
MMKLRLHPLGSGLLIFLLTAACAQVLESQSPTAEAADHLRYCEGVRVALTQRTDQSEYRRALKNFQACPASFAVGALLLEWKTPPTDTIAIELLAKTTGQFRDQRLVDAVLRTVANASLSRGVRVRGLHALISYVDPHSVAIFRQLDQKGLSGPRYVLLGIVDHVAAEQGPVPMRSSTNREIVQFLAGLSAKDQDSTIRTIAGYLADRLKLQDRKNTR